MKKYKIIFVQTESFTVDMLAKNKDNAIKLAEKKWDEGNYQETGTIRKNYIKREKAKKVCKLNLI